MSNMVAAGTPDGVVPGMIAARWGRIITIASTSVVQPISGVGISMDQKTEVVRGIPVGRYGDVDEFGAVVAFVTSRHAAYLTGSMLRVDGRAIDHCSEYGLDQRFNPQCRGPATGPQLDLESQVSDAGACRISAGNNMVVEPAFLFHWPPTVAIRVPQVNACNDPFRV